MTLPDAAQPLSADDAATAFDAILDGAVADDDIRDFLLTISLRDESAVEIAAAVRAIRARMIGVSAPEGAIDVCGTGGDMSNSLNVSTAVAIVVAACGVPVAKHGNRAASSQAGGADTLEALGLDLTRASATAEATLADLGIAFLFAQRHHPALGRLAPIRKSINRRTIFNLTGPACNPARVTRQLIGVARPDFLSVYAEALAMLGAEGALLGSVGGVAGVTLGIAIGQVLIHVVNPQSFNWTMTTQLPVAALIGIIVALILAAMVTAMIAARQAASVDAVRAVRSDW